MNSQSNSFIKRSINLFALAIKGEENNATEGSLKRAIVLLSVPMILEMVMESLFAIVDVYYVSKVSVNAVATIGLTESVLMLIESVAIGLSMALTALVARRVGEKKHSEAAVVAYHGVVIGVILSAIFGFAGIYYGPEILTLMGGSPELVREGADYTRVLLGGNLTLMMLFLINAIFRGSGDASLAMRSLWIANGLNIILDPIFIFGFWIIPAMGVEGAAVATTIGRGCGVIFQLYLWFGKDSILNMRNVPMTISLTRIKRLIKIAFGGMGQFLIGTASWIFLMRIVSLFGDDAVAGYTISIRVIVFTILPSWGMANAAATLVGQNLGANKPDRAEKAVWICSKLNMFFLGIISVFLILFSEPIIHIFSNEEVVVKIAKQSLSLISIGYVFFAYGMVMNQAFNGAGDTITPTILNVICSWVVQLPLAYFLAVYLNLGPTGVFVSVAISISLMAILSIYIFRKGKWKHIKI